MAGWNPWDTLEERPHIDIHWSTDGRRGCIDFVTSQITLRYGMSEREVRSVLAHELVHDERGPAPKWRARGEETRVSLEASRRLIPISDLLEAGRWATFLDEAAEALDVDVATLRWRIDHLSQVPEERARWEAVLAARGEAC